MDRRTEEAIAYLKEKGYIVIKEIPDRNYDWWADNFRDDLIERLMKWGNEPFDERFDHSPEQLERLRRPVAEKLLEILRELNNAS